jgi:TolB-like protein/Tfp pilus assembly protein PilF
VRVADLFVSYKSEDRDRVAPLVAALEADGIDLWWDAHLGGGAAWRDAIERELNAARCVLVVWSTRSTGPEGAFVRDEATRALRRGVYLPVNIDPVDPPLGFGETQALSLVGWKSDRADPKYRDVMSALLAIIAGKQRPAPMTRVIRRDRRRWYALAGVPLVCAAAIAFMASPESVCGMTGWRCSLARAAPRNSIAVLPFANLSGDPSQEYFSDGLSEELLGKLARVGPLQVTGRTSSFRFKGTKASADVIGRQLGVAYILDGSVRREGQTVRVTAQLIDASTSFDRWAATYDRDMKDILAVQSGIAEAVTEALRVKLIGNDVAALTRGGTSNPAAWDEYLRGIRAFDTSTGETSYRLALSFYDAAIAAAPDFAQAHAGRARTLVALANQFVPKADIAATYDAALASARTAVRLAPALADTQTTLALALVNGRHDFVAARDAYAAAMRTGSGDASVLTRYGYFQIETGATDAGIAALRRAVALDPLNPRAYKTLGIGLLAGHRYDDAIAAQQRALALNPGITSAHAEIGKARYLEGRLPEAQAAFALEPETWERLTGEAIVRHRLGDTAGAEASRAALLALGEGTSDYQLAQIYAQWGEPAASLGALDAALASGDNGITQMRSDPLLDPIRMLPAFKARIVKLGLDFGGTNS